jgi:hypothetical protein
MEAVIKIIISDAYDMDKAYNDVDYIDNLKEDLFDTGTHHAIAEMVTDAQYFSSFKKLFHYFQDNGKGIDVINAIDNKHELLNLYGFMYYNELIDIVSTEKEENDDAIPID